MKKSIVILLSMLLMLQAAPPALAVQPQYSPLAAVDIAQWDEKNGEETPDAAGRMADGEDGSHPADPQKTDEPLPGDPAEELFAGDAAGGTAASSSLPEGTPAIPEPTPMQPVPTAENQMSAADGVQTSAEPESDSEGFIRGTEEGANYWWKLDENGTLTIKGTRMPNWERNTALVAPWKEKKDLIFRVRIEKGMQNIGAHAFYELSNLTQAFIPDSVACIEGESFGECIGLKDISFGSGVTAIGTGAFAHCVNLVSVALPDSVDLIYPWAFRDCTGLTQIKLGRDIQRISEFAFARCAALKRVFIPSSLQTIERRAFYSTDLKDVYYGGTQSQWNAIAIDDDNVHLKCAAIYFENIDSQDHVEIDSQVFPVKLEECLRQTASTVYNPQLSNMLAALSSEAYNEAGIDHTLAELGFGAGQRVRCEQQYLASNLAVKQLEDGQYLALVVARGTVGTREWVSNFDLRLDEANQHYGFAYAAKELLDSLKELIKLQTGSEELSNIKFVLTGHSRGAAVANILAHELSAAVPSSNVYAYTFACPDVAIQNWDKQQGNQNIFNINHANDLVPLVPRALLEIPVLNQFFFREVFEVLQNSVWDKYGRSYWTNADGAVPEVNSIIPDAHHLNYYREFLRTERPIEKYRIRSDLKWDIGGIVLGIFCPVDVALTDKNGRPIVSVANGQIEYYDSEPDRVIVLTNEDRKVILVMGEEPFTVDFTATAKGEMSYVVASVEGVENGAFQVESEKTFEGVALAAEKQMISFVGSEAAAGQPVDVSDTPLYVLGQKGEFKTEVVLQPDRTTLEQSVQNTVIPLPGSGYKVGDGTLCGVQPNTLPAALRKNLANTGDAVVMNANGQPHDDAKMVGTGSTLGYGSDGSIGRVMVVVRGDVTGDGDVTVRDVIAVRQHILNIKPLEGAYLQASLIKSKDEPRVLDVIEMRKFILQIVDMLG